MGKIDHILAQMKQNPRGVRFDDLCKVCDHFLEGLVKVGAVIEYTKPHGKVILE